MYDTYLSLDAQVDALNKPEVAHENANKDPKIFHVQRDRMASAVAKARGLAMLPPNVLQAHINGDIHFHDLDYFPYSSQNNCSLPNYPDMLANGFVIGEAELETPKSVQVACSHIEKIIVSVASAQYGGITIEAIDTHLVPYIEKSYRKHLDRGIDWIGDLATAACYAEEMTEKEVYDALQALVYNLNTVASTQGQTPFVSIGFGLDTSVWGREVQKALLNLQMKGLGKRGITPIFPKLIYTLKDGINLRDGDPNYDIKKLAIKCSTERIYPDVIMADNLERHTGGVVTPMGCRSFLSAHESGYLGRMNLGVVTLNLPRVALQAYQWTQKYGRADREKVVSLFWRQLDKMANTVHEALRYKEARVRETKPENAPILYKYGAFARLSDGESIDHLFDNHRASLSFGYIGIYEAVRILYHDNSWEWDEDGRSFGLSIVEFLRAKVDEWNEVDRSGANGEKGAKIALYGTPSEALTDRFAQMDLDRFGVWSDVTDKGSDTAYYTNSFHLDSRVGLTEGWDPFNKLEFEAPFAELTSGGLIHYTEWPDRANPMSVEALWDWAYENNIIYMGVNFPVDKCFKCLFRGEFNTTPDGGFSCPQCGNDGRDDPYSINVVRRLCGYLASPAKRPVVKGRQAEIAQRSKHV